MPDRSRRPDALKRQKQRDAQAKARKREDRCRALSLGLQIGEDGRAVASLPMRRRFLIVCDRTSLFQGPEATLAAPGRYKD